MVSNENLDAEILQDILAGRKERFSELVERLGPLSYYFFYQRSGKNAEVARDLVQEAFLRAYEHLPSFKPNASFKAWFMGICRNLLSHFLRRRSLETTVAQSHCIIEPLVDFETDIVKKHLIQKVLSVLPESQRDVVELKFFFHLSCKEISSLLDLPLGTVKSHLYQSRLRLLEVLEEESA